MEKTSLTLFSREILITFLMLEIPYLNEHLSTFNITTPLGISDNLANIWGKGDRPVINI